MQRPNMRPQQPNMQQPQNIPINVHELLKQQIYSEQITPGSRNPANQNNDYMYFAQGRPYSAQTFGVSDSYLMLDSFTKSLSGSIQNGELSWNIQIQGSTNLDQNIIGSRNLLGNVIEIELGAFSLPLLREVTYPLDGPNPIQISNMSLIQNNATASSDFNLAPYLQPEQIPVFAPPSLPPPPTLSTPQIPWLNNPLTQTPFGGQITIQIKEAGTQAYNGGNTTSFHHFVYQLQYDTVSNGTSPNLINAVPVNNLFIFTEPIIDFPSISLVFRNPDNPIIFEPDIINCKIYCDFVNSINGKYFLSIIYENHNLLTEDRIYLKKFNSGYNYLDNYINSQNGILVGYPPDNNGDSQNIPTGVLLPPISATESSNTFYTDPFITFNDTFISGNVINIKGKLNKFDSQLITVTGLVVYSFGSVEILFNISLLSSFPITINNPFTIGGFTGIYTIQIDSVAVNLMANTVALTIDSSTATLQKLQVFSDVYVAKRRIRIPIRLRTVLNKVTNYITPT
jgi:hypothetical protein